MSINYDDLYWTCMVCGEERHDRFIGVALRHLAGMQARFPDVKIRVRYCNDRTDCTEKATRTGVWPEEDE